MKDDTCRLLVDDAFQAEINFALNGNVTSVNGFSADAVLQYSDDGSIVAVNNLRIADSVSGQLTYLVGSLNFLYATIADQLNRLHAGTKSELIDCKLQLVQLTTELLLRLAQVQSTSHIDSIIETIALQKLAIKKKAALWII